MTPAGQHRKETRLICDEDDVTHIMMNVYKYVSTRGFGSWEMGGDIWGMNGMHGSVGAVGAGVQISPFQLP